MLTDSSAVMSLPHVFFTSLCCSRVSGRLHADAYRPLILRFKSFNNTILLRQSSAYI